MKITKQWLESHGACQEGVEWVETLDTQDHAEIVEIAIDSGDMELMKHCNWGLARLMSREQRIKYAIYAAESVLHIFEEAYPEDKRPREAIEVAKGGLDGSVTAASADAAAWAARASARAADAAYDAAASARDAASAAALAVWTSFAASAAASASAAAGSARDAARAAAADSSAMPGILRYGIKLIGEGE